MRRACERWCETHDPRDCPLDVLAEAATDASSVLGRDLDAGEVERLCASVVATHVHDREQAEAEAAIASTREEERLAYVARTAQRIRLTRSDPPPRGKR